MADTVRNSESLQELHKASVTARALRSSLRRLVATLTTCSGERDSHEALLEQLRAEVRRESEDLEAQAASLPTCGGGSLFDSELKRAVAAPAGVPPRRSSTKRKAEGKSNDELAPRFRLRISEAPATAVPSSLLQATSYVLAAGAYSGRADGQGECGGIAALLSCGRLEVWERDLFSWHRTTTAKVRLPRSAKASLDFAQGGSQLWLALTGCGDSPSADLPAPVQTRLYLRNGATLRLSAILQGPPSILLAGPVTLSGAGTEGAAMMLSPSAQSNCCDVHVLQWHAPSNSNAGHLEPVSIFPVASALQSSRSQTSAGACDAAITVMGLWALPECCETTVDRKLAARSWRLAACVKYQGASKELQLRNGLGECLAVLPLEESVCCLAVPPQEGCPPEAHQCFNLNKTGFSFLLLLATDSQPRGEWRLCLAFQNDREDRFNSTSKEPAKLCVQTISTVEADVKDAVALATSEGLIGFSARDTSWLLDWQQQRVHALPKGWTPIAVGPSTVLARNFAGESRELVFFELG
mmetsp:Transcript_54486/g.97359  ORF Transcript_54486/g.97359 Transcript_54486/m.97359 type:complete len:526 (+) Transcript_54486:35-1612(+)|eukprot:CAMPEP_0197658678 /NCGR_PEP_ID=MMETSP1338-20131121/45375_1 /TAXON_ID=43686 ORGANISM="Pelagodinium beii, Strain RCC1491" /NCGR_SAMPLE_ID=MMETSP1338 /ASSEMBLY_ACC=CAM_ASM_000754 /LENGTH=525 /DNA_ID=CAMNT_0043235303 /DNA_START=35 /DNA_END=1612 /DNA_ORIENTATION=+